MEYLALYRKYRPKELDEVVGQNEIKKILASSVKNGTITHAYLFSGPRGTGKTTMAKILAKMVNCLDNVEGNACNKCESCLNILNSNDVIEIDAASNNGVDEIRELREKANLVPSNAKYKVYIIDEVHMLTTQAFNALLKTLEEPPKHVIFILATTEYYKIPLTITSRCQKFQFNKLSNDEIITRLREIANLEKINISDDALYEIATISDGGMRDSINFLDQLRSFSTNNITIDDVYEVCGNVSTVEIVNLIKEIKNNNCEYVTSFFEKMDATGKNYNKFLEEIVSFLKDAILLNKSVNSKFIMHDTEIIKSICNIFTTEELFYLIDNFNNLMDKLKNVSRQSLVIITNFLLIMNKINTISVNSFIKKESVSDKEKKYDVAFQFTSNNDNDENFNYTKGNNVDSNESNINNDNNDDNINNLNKNKEIIINNTFAVASKDIKNNLQQCFSNLNDYLTDKKFKVAAGSLLDTKIEVAGNSYMILSAINDAAVNKIYSNYKLCSELINNLCHGEYNFVVLSQEEWNKHRDLYVANFKSGKKYVLKELINSIVDEEIVNKEPTVVDKLFELVGEDNVEFK